MVAEMAQSPVESVAEVHNSLAQENGKLDKGPVKDESIIFGSHGGVGELVNGKESNVSNANLPKDVGEEWPEPRVIHNFYFIRHRQYDDPKIRAKIDLTDREIQRRNQARMQLMDELRAKRGVRGDLAAQLRSLKTEGRQYKSVMDDKRKEMEPLHQALGKLRTTNNARSGGICSSEEELDDLIRSLQYRIQHEIIPLSEEKQILREIKQLEGTREKVMANAAMRAKIQESMGKKEDIQDQVKLMGSDLDGVKKESQAVWAKISHLEGKVKALDEEIEALQQEVNDVAEKRDKAFANIKELRKQRDEGNAYFFQYRALLNEAKAMSVKKDVQGLKELSNSEVEKYMTLWNNNKAFRDDYEKRLLQSLDMRQLSRDGRIRNPDEKPLVVAETSVPSEPEIVAKPNVKQSKGDSKSASQKDTLPTQKVQKEAAKKETEDTADFEIPVVEKPASEKKVDEAKLREMKKEEDRAKAREGMERKRKKEEAKVAKAALRAEKQRKALEEKKGRSKNNNKPGASGTATTEESAVAEVEEAENADVNVEAPVEAPTPAKPRVRKENTVKYRSRARGPESLPKAILKRKKSTNYWVWAAPAAAVVLLILVLVYYYLQ